MTKLTSSLILAVALAGCTTVGDKGDLLAEFEDDAGKADAAKSTKLVDDLAADAVVGGTFDRKVRVYGYVVEARKGARLDVKLVATAGPDAEGVASGAALDTFLGVYGPFESVAKPGATLAESEDGDTLSAPPVQFVTPADGRYLVAFSSWQDTGKGKYQLDVACTGTDLQCRRPDWDAPCTHTTKYIQGGKINASEVWDACEVVLLEPTVVAPAATLTIQPGVQVKGNFLGTDMFGNVSLTVDGLLQAVGTAEHPISFTSLKADRGWMGLVITSKGNSLEHVVIERARRAVDLRQQANATLRDLVIEGVTLANVMSEAGVLAQVDVEATFERALVKGFAVGLDLLNARHLVIEDSVIRENRIGVRVTGANPTGGQCWAPAAPQTWRDPRIVHSDIIANTQQAMQIDGADVLVQVEDSNIVGNAASIQLLGGRLHPESYIRNNNIHHNGTGPVQITTYHRDGILDISNNYWSFISDPELSASWRQPCGADAAAIKFTGFSVAPIAGAGPRRELLTDPVKDGCLASQP